MKINQDFEMSVQTILYLKNRKTNDYLQACEIAKALDYSVGYLQKVIQILGKYRILECKRGRVGGVKIRAKNITLLDLWNATCGEPDLTNPNLAIMKKPLKAFMDSMRGIVIYNEKIKSD